MHRIAAAMALVDSLLKLMTAQGADVLVIPAEEPPRIEKQGEPRSLSMPALGRDMVEMMVQELLDPAQAARVAQGEAVESRYATADGESYGVLVEPRGDGPRLTLRRGSETAEGASSPAATAPTRGAEPTRGAAPTSGATTRDPGRAPTPSASGPRFPVAPSDPHAEPPLPPPESRSTPLAANEAPVPLPTAMVTPRLEPLRAGHALDPGPLASILALADREHASDILLSHGSNARLRVAGEITELGGHPVDEAAIRQVLGPLLGSRAQQELAQLGSTDLAVRMRLGGRTLRYRANLFLQRGGLALALRPVRSDPPTLDVLNLPEELASLGALPSGLVLMTGTAGSGKSTTLVALIEQINRSAPKHVITLEDPIEYEYTNRRSLVHQRELGVHVSSFSAGLRSALRESPDVILVGEMRDHETMSAALTAAETGHLVLSTLHAADAAMAIDRIIDSFPEHQQGQIRFQLAGSLRAIVTQRLLPSRTLPQRVPAIELLRVNTAVATKIREGRGHQILSEIQKGRADGMLSFEISMARLVRRGVLSPQTAMAHASDPALMAEHLHGKGV